MSSSPIWRLVPGQRLVHRCHDGECVLFNDLTGATHLLGQDVLDVLGMLRAGPQPAAMLASAAGAGAESNPGLDPALDPHFLNEVDELLADLAALSLVEVQPC
ncbi:MAG TPA: hypothetical protein DDX04_03690 [Massilia sp.]|nr:hypothetical protein [Massilia sp.]